MPGTNYTRLFARNGNRQVSTSSSSSSSHSRKQRLARVWPWLSLSFGLLWLIPSISILALNFKNVIVGPSIGCLTSKKCHLNLQSTTQIQQAKTWERDDQQALAGLQLAAKALDAWFCFIAASLVWSILKRLAGQDSTNSLPVGYIHLHTECSDFRVIPKLFWGRRRDASRMERGWSRTRLYLLITFVTFVCILCNLMGPATAVLIIPNLEWITINQAQDVWFQSIMSNSRPINTSIAQSCDQGNLTNSLYSCTYKSFGATTDMITAAAVATNDQVYNVNGSGKIPFSALLLPPVLQEENVSFSVNISNTFTMWVPSRQVLRDLTADLKDYDTVIGDTLKGPSNHSESALFTRSLQSRLQHHGPVMGQNSLCYVSSDNNHQNFTVGTDRDIRCYERIIDDQSLWTCVPVGPGWKDISPVQSSFTILDILRTGTTPTMNNNSSGTMTVDIYATPISFDVDNSTFYAKMSGHDFDWSTAFLKSQLLPKRNFTGPQQVFEYKRIIPLQATGLDNKPLNLTEFIWCQSQSQLGLADYALNPSPLSNRIRLIELNIMDKGDDVTPAPQPIYVHPDWTLAAWSVDPVGLNNAVSGRRGAARKIQLALEGWIYKQNVNEAEGTNSQESQDFRNIHKFMGAQTLSMIPHTVTTTKPKDVSLQPALSHNAMVQIWKYDLKTPSNIFGLVIVLLGAIFVVVRTVVYAMDWEEMKDATQILVTALKQAPKRSSHSRNDSSTASLQPPATPPDMNLMDADVDYDDEEEEKEFPVVYVSPVTTPNLSGGPPLAVPPKRVPYKRRISFHG